MRKKTRRDHIVDAAKAHTDLVLLYKIAELAEGSDLTSARYKTAEKIVRLCKREAGKCLNEYDRAVALACQD